jgi:hypothetical protein
LVPSDGYYRVRIFAETYLKAWGSISVPSLRPHWLSVPSRTRAWFGSRRHPLSSRRMRHQYDRGVLEDLNYTALVLAREVARDTGTLFAGNVVLMRKEP